MCYLCPRIDLLPICPVAQEGPLGRDCVEQWHRFLFALLDLDRSRRRGASLVGAAIASQQLELGAIGSGRLVVPS